MGVGFGQVKHVNAGGHGVPPFIRAVPGIGKMDRSRQLAGIEGPDVLPHRIEDFQFVISRVKVVFHVDGNGSLARGQYVFRNKELVLIGDEGGDGA